MHQPNYREARTNHMAMPWVRLHALKDYLDMPQMAAAHEDLRVTFNLVPSLLDQLDLYLDGGSDQHLSLSRQQVEQLGSDQKQLLLQSFFSANPTNMIAPSPRYLELYRKYQTAANEPSTLPGLFSSEELRDLQVWSNLAWVDPLFRNESPIASLFAKGKHFTEEEKHALLDWQAELIGRIVPTYRKLQDDGRIEVSFTPYYHPILPLLCDSDIATEALPSIVLPPTRFVHPEDAEQQMRMSIEKYRDLFGRDLVGVWPSEGSVSEEVLRMLGRLGVKWVASDEEILHHSLTKAGLSQKENAIHTVYQFGDGPKLLFRDHALSDRIGFVYSTWDADRAAADFIGHLKNIRSIYENSLDQVVVSVILDGENAWEYFPNDGSEFLGLLYKGLAEEPTIQTVTMSEAVESIPARPLPSLFAGSWINHNFSIWIGHEEDNAAWELLGKAREDLVNFERDHPEYDPDKLKAAWNQIYVAEGSDWCWWYGDEHRGAHNKQFDHLYRQHLKAIYELLDLEIPVKLARPIYNAGLKSMVVMPEGRLSPRIDGRRSNFYEWSGAGYFDCLKDGAAMHRVDQIVSGIYFAFDREQFYIRLDFRLKNEVELLSKLRIVVTFFVPGEISVELNLSEASSGLDGSGQHGFAFDEILELAVARSHLWPEGFGTLGFSVTLYENEQRLENWPESDPIRLEVPSHDQEIFWPI